MEYSEAQQKIIDRYLEATKHCPDERMPLEKLIGMRKKFPKARPDKYVVAKCESEALSDEFMPTGNKGRKKRVLDNSYVKSKLCDYEEYEYASDAFYWLDDILQGVAVTAFEGATRPLSKHLMYDVLSTARSVDTELIEDVCNVAERQARKVMAALVVANRAVEKEFRRMDVCGLDVERRRLFLT